MNVLFVCSHNVWRSRTAEEIFKNTPGITVRSAGTSVVARRKISKEDLEWAKTIYVMEDKHKEIIQKRFGREFDQKIKVLNIPDDYVFMDEELIEILKSSVEF